MSETERRRIGLEKLVELYGEDFGLGDRLEDPTPESGPLSRETVEHLFAEIWNGPGLSTRDRRLLVLGVIAGLGRSDLAEAQLVGALRNGELTREELGEVVLQLAFYAGWPRTTSISRAARAAAKRVFEEE